MLVFGIKCFLARSSTGPQTALIASLTGSDNKFSAVKVIVIRTRLRLDPSEDCSAIAKVGKTNMADSNNDAIFTYESEVMVEKVWKDGKLRDKK